MANIADLVIRVLANTAPAEKDLKSLGAKTHSTFSKGLLPAVAVLGAVGIAAKKAADKASDLSESQNAVNVVFGKSAGKMAKFAQVADKQAGLSMRQFNELVTPVGAGLRNMGDSADVAATKSINLAKRAADMASVFNTSVPEAMQAIQAGLRGEADPLERFGVGLNDAAVSAKAMEMGLGKTKAALTAGDKAQARYALLMEQTNRFQGDFVRTSGGAANAARINAAAQENLTAKIGTGLLPVMQTFQNVMGVVLGVMAKHPQAVMVLAAALSVLAIAIIAVNVAFMLAASPVYLVILALVALGVAIAALWMKCEAFREVVTQTWERIKAVTQAVWPTVKAIITTYITAAVAVVRTYVAIAVTVLTTAWRVIQAVTQAVWPTVRSVVVGAMSAVKTAVDIARAAIDLIRTAIEKVAGPATTVAGIVKGALSTAFGVLKTAAGGVKSVLDGIASVLDSVASAAGKAASAIEKVMSIGKGVGGVLGHIPGVPHFASGVRNFGGGLAMVGERGPELVGLPRGSSVFTNSDSRRMLEGGGDSGRNSPLIGEVHVHDRSDYEVLAGVVERRLAFS